MEAHKLGERVFIQAFSELENWMKTTSQSDKNIMYMLKKLDQINDLKKLITDSINFNLALSI